MAPFPRLVATLTAAMLVVPAGSALAAGESPPPVPPTDTVRVERSDALPPLTDSQRAELLAPGSRQDPSTRGESVVAPPAVSRSAAWSDAAPPYSCPGYSSIPSTNPRDQVIQDRFAWGTYGPYRVGDGRGNVNWSVDPHRQVSWRMWLHSLRWVGSLVTAGEQGDRAALEHASAIVSDWVRDNPYSWQSNAAAWESTMHRTNVLVCLRQAVSKAHGGTFPSATHGWLGTALLQHAEFMKAHYSGYGNHGTDESIAMIGAGCVLRRPAYTTLGADRLRAGLTRAIDSQGATNEQSTAYAVFNHSLWGRAQRALTACLPGSPTTQEVTRRRAALAEFIAHATTPAGPLHQIGDSEQVRYQPLAAGAHEWAASGGRAGGHPAARPGQGVRRRVCLRPVRLGHHGPRLRSGVRLRAAFRARPGAARPRRPHVAHVAGSRAGRAARHGLRRVHARRVGDVQEVAGGAQPTRRPRHEPRGGDPPDRLEHRASPGSAGPALGHEGRFLPPGRFPGSRVEPCSQRDRAERPRPRGRGRPRHLGQVHELPSDVAPTGGQGRHDEPARHGRGRR